MALLLIAAGWSFIATLVGLVAGIPELRTAGAAGVCLFVLLAFLLDRYSKPADSWESHIEDSDGIYIEFFWPPLPQDDERRAA